MSEPYKIIKRLLRTEKVTNQESAGKYLFEVACGANKLDIKEAVEDLFKVDVTCVNTMNMHGKLRRVRYKWGKRPDWKKAVVTLKQGEKIELK